MHAEYRSTCHITWNRQEAAARFLASSLSLSWIISNTASRFGINIATTARHGNLRKLSTTTSRRVCRYYITDAVQQVDTRSYATDTAATIISISTGDGAE